jgi:Domain of unknown function (DUF3825)
MVTREELLEGLGNPYTNRVVDRFHRFAFVPRPVLERLAREALAEEWGRELFALEKYLAVHVAWSIEQGALSQSDNQFYLTAGHLQTRYGTPLYLVFERNQQVNRQPFFLRAAGSYISAPELPTPPDIPAPLQIPVGAEVVMMHDHILEDQAERVPFLRDTPRVAQMCAIAGAIQWSINRGLHLPYWYYGRMNYIVPLYLTSRENITLAPDLVAPVQVNPNSLLVRTVLEPAMPYANARVSVRRHDQLPAWLLDGWTEYSQRVTDEQLEDPETIGAQPRAEA